MSDPIARLRASFLERCRADQKRLAQASPDEEIFASIIHRLAGAAGSFGFSALSEAASAVDHSIRSGEQPATGSVDALMRELCRVADTAD